MLIDTFREISGNPGLGKNYEEVIKSLFGFKAGRHIIFYRILEKSEIEITRILLEQMDLGEKISE